MSTKIGRQQKQNLEDNTGGGRTNTSASRYNHNPKEEEARTPYRCLPTYLSKQIYVIERNGTTPLAELTAASAVPANKKGTAEHNAPHGHGLRFNLS